MKFNYSKSTILIILIFLVYVCSVSAQQSNKCKPGQIRFERGKSSIIVRGKLQPCDKRIYKFRALQGQNISVVLLPIESNLLFWLQEPKAGLLKEIGKGGVTEWSGKLPDNDEYEIYVSTPPVMNSEQTRLLPFRLKLEIN